MQIQKAFLTIAMMVSVSFCAHAEQALRWPSDDSKALIEAAREEISFEHTSGHASTACDLYLEKVLSRAGYRVEHFLANDFAEVAARDLPGWKPREFFLDAHVNDRAALETFLNHSENGTAFLAQWVRSGPHGHVALVVKVADNEFVIYQAQLGRSIPEEKSVTVDGLLYEKNNKGDRGHLRLFYE